MIIFTLIPMIFVVYYAFTDATGAFTINNVKGLLGLEKETQNVIQSGTFIRLDFVKIFWRSMWYGAVATVVCLLIAYPVAYFVSQMRENRQQIIITLVMLPMWMNFILRTYALMKMLEDTGIINTAFTKLGLPVIHMINTPFAVILGMVYNFLPYMVLPIYSVMSKMDYSLIEAAQDLGCNRMRVFTKVILPLSMGGVVSGITMVFVPSVSTFYISQKLGGGTNEMIGDVIERTFLTETNYNVGAAISLVLMILIFICMAVMNRFSEDESQGGSIIV
ncbi:MAG: ABC transporter permease [Clostridia bacterium]|nr:ABC transporter permease [Clostridia bacterium]